MGPYRAAKLGGCLDCFKKNFLDTNPQKLKSALPHKIVYSVNLPGRVHFIALDNVSQSGFGDDQLDWLEKDLTQARSDPESA